MAVRGFVTHARRNDRLTLLMFGGFVLAVEVLGAVVLTFFTLFLDPAHTIFVDPLAYLARYFLPVSAVATAVFAYFYLGHADQVRSALGSRLVDRQLEPRLWRIVELQCAALGIRDPRVALIETDARNALSCGATKNSSLIIVTRGLIDSLDDDELGAVIAHECAHLRNHDTRTLAAAHAWMCSAVRFQTHNVLRIDMYRQFVLFLVWPALLILSLLGGALTMLAMRISRWAQRGIALARDHIADGEAVRATKDPAALLDALRKSHGGHIENSDNFDALLFAGCRNEAAEHARERYRSVASLSASMLTNTGRLRRDTREAGPSLKPASGGFGRKWKPQPVAVPATAAGPSIARGDAMPERVTLEMMLTDWDKFRRLCRESQSYMEWREEDGRNMFGLAPRMQIPVAMLVAFLMVFHWPTNGDFTRMKSAFSPFGMMTAMDVTGTFQTSGAGTMREQSPSTPS
jgi:Zn-dependent protease with chaperone function